MDAGYTVEPTERDAFTGREIRTTLRPIADSENGPADGPLVTIADVGFGISQLLPVIVQFVVGRGCVVMIEQPELHIHPALQSEIADLLIEARSGNVALIETHSEHVLLRLLRRIKEDKVGAKDVSVQHIHRNCAGSSVEAIGVGSGGELLDPWPAGFFREREKELHALMRPPR